MKLENIAIPQVAFDPRLDNQNIFAESFGALSHEEWGSLLIASIDASNIEGVEFPTFPPAETQNRIHGHDGVSSVTESLEFYKFACDSGVAGPGASDFGSGYMLDFGSGWGRIVRPFMRDFPLRKIIGYEPSGMFATIARANNPYIAFLCGDYIPDGALPENRFSLITGWSVYSHLSEPVAISWLKETARILKVGGAAIYTTWGMRFLSRLQAEKKQMEAGNDIHWYSKVCLVGAGDIEKRIEEYNDGKFVWFDSLKNDYYGETFISYGALKSLIDNEKIPLEIELFDDSTLEQDVFILRRI
jgi:SAM-dependent methyltransferase